MSSRIPPRTLGHGSLAVMVAGMVAMETLLHLEILHPGGGWRILATGFEAGTVGAVADWYAVRAMFHRVPLPILGRHSDILLRNRARITDAIVDAVQNRWLSSQAIGQFLQSQSPAALAMAYLREPANQRQLVAAGRHGLQMLAADQDQMPLEKLLERLAREQLARLDLAPWLGRHLADALKAGRHQRVWDALLDSLSPTLDDARVRSQLADVMRRTAERYARSGRLRALGRKVMESVGMIDYDAMADATLAEAKLFIAQARHQPDHPLRRRVDAALLDAAHQLVAGQGPVAAAFADWQRRLAGQVDWPAVLGPMVGQLRRSVLDQLADGDSEAATLLTRSLAEQIARFEADPARQAALDDWLRDRLPELVARHSHLIGDVVRGRLAAADDGQWVREIEDNVGDDLQYIRLNGAVVGFAVGLVLATLRLMMVTWL